MGWHPGEPLHLQVAAGGSWLARQVKSARLAIQTAPKSQEAYNAHCLCESLACLSWSFTAVDADGGTAALLQVPTPVSHSGHELHLMSQFLLIAAL